MSDAEASPLWCPECGTKMIGANVDEEGECRSCNRTARWHEHTVSDGGVPSHEIPAWTFHTEHLSFTIVDHGFESRWTLHCPGHDVHEELVAPARLRGAKTQAVDLIQGVLYERLRRINAALKELTQ